MSFRLVFGASGYIGSHLAPYLAARGLPVRATSRNIEVIEGRDWQNVELAQADALQPETLDRVLKDVDVAYYLVHSMAAGKNFPELDATAARNFADAAARQGVSRIVYLGGLVPKSPKSTHLRSRKETGDILRAGSVRRNRDTRWHDHRTRIRGLGSHSRSRQSPSFHDNATLGVLALDTHRAQ